MKIAFVGGLGFIGSRAVKILSDNGHDVVVMDIRTPESKTDDFSFIHQDVRDYDSLYENLKKEKPDVVYDLAGTTLNEEGSNPRYSVGLDVWGLSNVFEAAVKLNIEKVFYASSFYAYQGIDIDKIVDESDRSHPFLGNLLGSSKIAGERVVKSYTDINDISFVIFRFGSAYGHSTRCTSVPYFLFKEGMVTGKVTIWGEGNRMNQYTFVDNIAQGVADALNVKNEIINLIGPERTSMKELAEIFHKNFDYEPVFLTDKKEGPSFPTMKCDKAKNLLGWKTTNLIDGLKQTFKKLSS